MSGLSLDEQQSLPSDETIVRPRDTLPPGLKLENRAQVRAYLEVTSGPGRGQRFYLSHKTHVMGRSLDADISLPDDSISRQHAQVLWRNEQYILLDLGSKNGTFLNGTSVHECPLHTGDELSLGNHTLQFLLEAVRNNTL